MALDPPSSRGAPDVVRELQKQARSGRIYTMLALGLSAASLIVAVIALIR